MRQAIAVLSIAAFIVLADCVDREKTVPPDAVRVETTGTETGDLESVQPNVHPLTPEEYAAMTTASDTAQPLKQAETRTAHFPKPARPAKRALTLAAPTALQAPRLRSGIGYPINVSPSVARMNLAIMMNARIPAQSWAKANMREAVGIGADGTIPVPLWRLRTGNDGIQVATYITDIPVPASLDPTYQFVIPAALFRGGDRAVIEDVPADAILVEISGNAVIYPFISAIYSSGDPATIYGARMRFEGAR